MRILIVTAGSRGDVAPFTGLAHRLQDAGHRVAIAAHDRFAELVHGCGLEHRSLPGDPVEMARARTAAPSAGAAGAVFAGFLHELGAGLVDAVAAGTDLVLTAFGPAPLSRVVAEGLGLPSMGTYLVPGVPTAHFALPGLPEPRGGDPAANLATGRELVGRTAALYADVLAPLRARLGLPAVPAPHAVDAADDWPICHGVSPSVVPRPDDWPSPVRMSGYWWPARPTGWHPPGELLDFLQAGPAPVFVGFGSMTPAEGERLSELVAAAVSRAGVRAVVQAGWAGLTPVGDDILGVDDLPHDWLFPRTAAVVHHAGAGTTAAGLRAGVPAVAVPVMLDQPFWAARLHRLGVAPPPLPHAELAVDTLAAAVRSCLDDASLRRRAQALGDRVRAEDGAGAVLARITG